MKPAKRSRIWTGPNCSNKPSTLTMLLFVLLQIRTRPVDQEAAAVGEVEAAAAAEVAALERIMTGIR